MAWQTKWLVVAGGLLWAGSAHASDADSCAFRARGSTWRLTADCQTDRTLVVPDGYTLDGAGHTVRAVDPPGGSFEGAVVRNGGSEAHVRNLRIVATDLAARCHGAEPVDQRLRAILFEGASGSILNNRIAIDQGDSGCLEGDGIEVRAGDTTDAHVLISGNRIERFQKTGIYVRGPIAVDIYLNRVQGRGPLDYIVQNGLQLRDDVTGHVKLNHVSDVQYVAPTASATGILVTDVSVPLELSLNHVDETDIAIRLTSVSHADVGGNLLRSATYDGITIDGRAGAAQHNRIVGNQIYEAGIGVDLFGAGASKNLVTLNHIHDAGVQAIQQLDGAVDNLVRGNVLHDALQEVLSTLDVLPAPLAQN